MKAKKQKKSAKALKTGKKLEAQKPLVTVPLTDIQITKIPVSGNPPPGN